MSNSTIGALALLVLSGLFLLVYLPVVCVTRLVFTATRAQDRWVRALGYPIGPYVPAGTATRPLLREAARLWFVMAIGCAMTLMIELSMYMFLENRWALIVLCATVVPTLLAGVVACVESIILLLRAAVLRPPGRAGERVDGEKLADQEPPNYTLHPSSGVGLGADFVRRLARRG